MPRKKSIPTYRLHRQSGQAIVTLTDGLGNRRDVLLGKYNTSESRVEYARVLAEWEPADIKLIVAGSSNGNDFAVARLNINGSLEGTFDSDGKQTIDFGSGGDLAHSVTLQTDGKIVVAGVSNQGATGNDFAVARLNCDGSLDNTFDGDGKQTIDFGSSNDQAKGVVVQADGRIVLAGSSNEKFGVARLNVSLESSSGTLTNVTPSLNPAPDSSLPTGTTASDFPIGFFSFTVQEVSPGGATTVTINLPAGVAVNTYYKYGVEPTDDPTTADLDESTQPHWYPFLFDSQTQTGAVLPGQIDPVTSTQVPDNQVILHFVDGQRGDDDQEVNGVVVDPGAPALERLAVQIDIKPGDGSNTNNVNSNGTITVAILGSASFDAAQVDALSVVFAGAHAFQSAWQDVNGDGLLDCVLQFRTQDTFLSDLYAELLADDLDGDGVLDSSHQTAQVALTGKTADDTYFAGSDSMDLFLSGKALRDLLDSLAAAGAL